MSIQTRYGFSLAGCPPMTKEHWEADIIKEFLGLLDVHDAFIDIGANVGIYSCLAASRSKHVIAFEPCPRNLGFFYRNLSENQFSKVEVFPIGLASKCGLGRIYGFSDMASFVPGWAQSRTKRFSVVPLHTFDTLMSGRLLSKKLLIKIDVEGFELDVLSGAIGALDRDIKPTWIVEILLSAEGIPGGINPRFSETFDMFWKHGYRCHMLSSELVPVEQADVKRWVADGRVDPEMHDFLFTAS